EAGSALGSRARRRPRDRSARPARSGSRAVPPSRSPRAYSGRALPTLSATQTGLLPPSASTVNLVTTWTQPPPTSSTDITSAVVRTFAPDGTGAGKRTLFQP